MRRVCAWCGKNLSPRGDDEAQVITHGICAACLAYFDREDTSLLTWLNKLPAPVLVADAQGVVLAANDSACKMLGKDPAAITGRLGGDAFECAYAKLPGGCGQTVHCRTCTIRMTVTDTYTTGRNHERVPAYPDLSGPEGVRHLWFLISTQKVGEVVLLRIDEVGAR